MPAKESADSKIGLAEMMDIIQLNPYRLLGIYSNSPTRERVANHNRMKAFLKVGKQVSFPLDLPSLLSLINRTTENIAEADAKLTLPSDQLKYAQFWFIKSTPIDDIAMNHLFAGNIDNAISIWQKKDNASSLQNRIVCALLQDDFATAIMCADKLYSLYSSEFINSVLGENHAATNENLPHAFLDTLCNVVDVQKLLPYMQNNEWKQYVGDKNVKPLIATLQAAISIAKASKGKGPDARLAAGTKLMNDTKKPFAQLKTLLSANDLQYQMIADKLAQEILQCGIDYYNESEAADAAYKAMKLQTYALSIVVGKMAKDRCKENVGILQNIIDNLPPQEVFVEDKAIKEELRKFQTECYHLKGCKTMLVSSVPYIISMKSKLGINDKYYIKISTFIANILLSFIIEEFNSEVNDSLKDNLQKNEKATLWGVMWMLRFCWNIILNIECLNTSEEFKNTRLNPNKKAIGNFITQLDSSFIFYADNKMNLDSQLAAIRSRMDKFNGISVLAANLIEKYFSTWYKEEPYWLIRGINGENYDVFGRSIPLTNGFMFGCDKEELIDLRTEEEYFNECKNVYDKKTVFDNRPYEHKYDTYIEKFPNGKFIEIVKSYKSTSRHEYELYKKACTTIEGCKQYIKKYSSGWYINQIKEKLDTMIFEKYKLNKDLKAYIREYPNGKNVSYAKDIIKKKNKAIFMWFLGILIPTVVISLFLLLDWSIIAAIIVAVLVTSSILGNLMDD